jgi:uncharacterized membrane protein HdeD (DUF308 family)
MSIALIILGLIEIEAVANERIDCESPAWFWVLLCGIFSFVLGIFCAIEGA